MSFFNFSGVRSPPSRIMPQTSNVSPFCTSPTQLEDTLDPNGTFFPGGVRSPRRGFSVKEYEEELNKLSKENFSLKLRIYFLEERIGRIAGPHDIEQAVKNNIELKVENEAFRKELKEKHDLLCQAVKALDLVEEEHKKQEDKHCEELAALHNHIRELENENAHLRSVDKVQKYLDNDTEKIYKDTSVQMSETAVLFTEKNKTEDEIKRLQSRIEELESEVHNLESSLDCEKDHSAQLEFNFETYECTNCQILEGSLQTKEENLLVLGKMVEEKQAMMDQQSRICTEMDSLVKIQIDKVDNLRQTVAQKESAITTLQKDLKEALETKEDVNKLNEKVKEQQEQILKLETEKHTACKAIQSCMVRDKTLNKQVNDLKTKLKTKDKEILALEGQINKIKGDLSRSSKSSSSPVKSKKNSSVMSLNRSNASMPIVADKEHSWGGVETSRDKIEQLAELMDHNSEPDTEMNKQVQDLLQTLQVKEEQLQQYENDITLKNAELNSKDNRIVELEMEVEALKIKVAEIKEESLLVYEEKQDTPEKTIEEWSKEAEIKNKKIEQLEAELRKRTVNLQEIVNKELWDKNREIERLQRRLRDLIEKKEVEINSLKSEIESKDLVLKSYEIKSIVGTGDASSASDLEVLSEKLKDVQEENKYLKKKFEELKHVESECVQKLEKSRKEKQNVLDVCGLLTTRLEELALFLDSLLKHRSVSSLLGNDKQKVIKNAIEKSLDLSRTLSMSITLNPNQSLMELSSLSELLNSTRQSLGNLSTLELDLLELDGSPRESHITHLSIIPNNVSLTYNSHLSVGLSKESITWREATLNSQMSTVKPEINLREVDSIEEMLPHLKRSNSTSPEDIENDITMQKEKLNVSISCVDNQSESEAWSEPDRSVSLARMGLVDDSLKTLSPGNGSVNRSRLLKYRSSETTESTEDEEENVSRSPPKRQSEERVSSSRRSLFGGSQHNVSALQEQVATLSAELKEKDNEILTMQCLMLQLENKFKEEKLNLMQQFEKLKAQRNEAEQFVKQAEEKVSQAEIKEHESEKDFMELKSMVAELVKQRETFNIDAENNVKNAMKKIELLEKERDKAIEDAITSKEITDKAVVNIRIIQIKYDTLEENYQSLEKELKIKYNAEMQERLKEIESEWTNKIQMIESINNKLHCELEESKSTALLEYNKLIEIKTKLEEKISNLEQSYREMCSAKEEAEKLSILIEERMTVNEQQKAELEIHVSELENQNADLHNRLVKLQSLRHQNFWSKSAQTSPQKMFDASTSPIVNRRTPLRDTSASYTGNNIRLTAYPAGDFSGYTSEEILGGGYEVPVGSPGIENVANWCNRNQSIAEDRERTVNSSPDLGIESDQGRFSSLETNMNASTIRPLLQTIEITHSVNNMLEAATNTSSDKVLGVYENQQPDVEKLYNENLELKRKLLRTKRVLENTLEQLNKLNEQKKRMEKQVHNEVLKTSLVLRKARANLDSGSETEIVKMT